MSTKALPQGWTRTTLGILKWGSGGTPHSGMPEYYGGEIPWLVIGDLRDSVVTESETKITEAGLLNSSAKWVEPGSVLVAMYGSIGKLGIAGRRLTTNQAIAFTKPPPEVDAKYLFWFLAARRAELIRLGKGGAQQNISQTVLKAFPFDVAPSNEQHRLVAEVERQITRLDAGVDALKRVQMQLKRYRASVLKAACEGRLVPTEAELARREKRDYEPAEKLLERILKERRARWEADQLAKMKAAGKTPKDDKWKAKYAEPDCAAGRGRELPVGWQWTRLGVLVQIRSGYAFRSEDYIDDPDAVPLVRQSELKGRTVSLANAKRLPKQFLAEYGPQFGVKQGDILVGLSGSLSSVAVFEDPRPALQNQRTGLLQISSEIHRQFALITYLSVVEQIEKSGKGVAVQNVAPRDIEALQVPLPPLAEQRRIASEFEVRFSIADACEAAFSNMLARSSSLRSAILRDAFDGRLVAQEPTDEPASKLLERLQQAATSEPAPEQRRSKRPTKAPAKKASA